MFDFCKALINKILGLFGRKDQQVPEIIKPKIKTGIEALAPYMGLNEDQNADIIAMKWSEYGRPKYDHTYNWCGLAVAMAEVESGYLKMEEVPRSFEASRRWLAQYPKDKYDLITEKSELIKNDLVISWRTSKESWEGHITIFKRWSTSRGKTTSLEKNYYKYFYGDGGNQNDSFSTKACQTARFLGALRRKA